jgi:hypothetical protein
MPDRMSSLTNLTFALQGHFGVGVGHNPSGCNAGFQKIAE